MKSIHRTVVVTAVLALGLANITFTASTAQADPEPTVGPTVAEARLISGDVVGLDADGDVSQITPAPRPDGTVPQFSTSSDDDQVYVIPDDVESLVPDQLDRELFNVTKLSSYATDTTNDTVPVIITQADDTSAQAAAQEISQSGVDITDSLDTLSAQVGQADASTDAGPAPAWDLLQELGTAPTSSDDPVSSQTKVWLDEQVQMAPSFAAMAVSDSTEPGWMSLIGRDEAHSEGYTGTGITVGIVDSGIDPTHPDLAGQVASIQDFTGTGLGDGYGHGTFVASEIAGTGAASGGQYAGVAPDAKLIIARVLDSNGNSSESEILSGLEWAAQQGADVINVSIGIPGGYDNGTSPASILVNRLVRTYGCTIVVAAGNDGGAQAVVSPATADEAIAVGATYVDGTLASFSSYGPRRGDGAVKPEIVAPGAASRAAGDGIVAAKANSTTYMSASGTSMAAPLVTGAVALLLQQNPELTPDEVRAKLMASASPLPLSVFQQGAGMLDIPAALAQQVTASPAELDLGTAPFPTATLTYLNQTSTARTYDLTASAVFAASLGSPVPLWVSDPSTDGPITLSASSLTLPPGGTASVDVRLNPISFSAGYVGGYITATSGDSVIRTPVGWANQVKPLTLVFSADATTIPAGGLITATANVTTVDVPVANAPVTFSVPDGLSVTGDDGTATCMTDQDGNCTVTITSDTPGRYVDAITANISGMNPVFVSSPLSVLVTGTTPTPQVTVSLVNWLYSGINMGGHMGYPAIEVSAKDSQGRAVDGVRIDFTVDGDSLVMNNPSCVTGSGVIYDFDYTYAAPTGYCSVPYDAVKPGPVTVHVLYDGLEATHLTTWVYPPDEQTTQLQVTHVGQPADGVSATVLTGVAFDNYGLPQPDVDLFFSVDGTGAVLSSNTCKTGEDGTCFVTLTSTVAGGVWVDATRDGSDILYSPAGVIFGPETACTALQGNTDLSCGGAVGTSTIGGLASENEAPVGTSVAVRALLMQLPLDWPVWSNKPLSSSLQGVTVRFVIDGDAQASSTTCTTNENGYCNIAVTSDNPGTVTISAFVGDWALTTPWATGDLTTITFTSDAVQAGDWFTAAPTSGSSVAADGVSSWTGTLTLTDTNGNPVTTASCQDIGFIVPTEVSVSDLTNNGDGTYTVSFTSSTPGQYEVTAYAAPSTPNGYAMNYWPRANSSTTISFDPVNTTPTVTLEGFYPDLTLESWATAGSALVSAHDGNGALLDGVTVDFTEEGDAVALTDSSCTTGSGNIVDGDAISSPETGYCTAAYHGVQPGDAVIHAFYNGVELEGSPMHITVYPGISQSSRLQVARTNQPADGTSTAILTGWAYDSQGTAVPDVVMSFSIDEPGAQLSADSCRTGEDGSCVVMVTSTHAGGFTVHASIDGKEVGYSPAGVIFDAQTACADLTDNPVFSCEASAYDFWSLGDGGGSYSSGTLPYQTVEAPAGSSVRVRLFLWQRQLMSLPEFLNLDGVEVTYLIEGDHETTSETCIDDARTGCSIVLTRETPGTVTVRAFVGDMELGNGTGTIVFTDDTVPGGDWLSVAPSSGSSVLADGVSSWTGTLTLTDTNGNPITTATPQDIGFILPDEVSVSGLMNNDDGTYTVSFTSSTPGQYDITAYAAPYTSDWPNVWPRANAHATISFDPIAQVPDLSRSSLTTSVDQITVTPPPCDGDPTIDPASVTVTATVKDTTGQPIDGATVDFSVESGLLLTGASSVQTDADGVATTTVTVNLDGNGYSTVYATVDGMEMSIRLLVFINDPNTRQEMPTLTVTPTSLSPVLADGQASYTAVVTALNECGSGVPGVEIRFGATGQANLTVPSGFTDLDGTLTSMVTDSDIEQVDVSASTLVEGQWVPVGGSPVNVTFIDPQGPPAPSVSKANAAQISGSARADTTVVVTYPVDGGTNQAETDVTSTGTWTVPTPADAIDGPLSVQARDVYGRLSTSVLADLDVTPPEPPRVSVFTDTQISGTAEAGASVEVVDAAGDTLGIVAADGDGNWLVFIPASASLARITLTATDAAGNVSEPRTLLAVTQPEPDPTQSDVSVSADSIGVIAGTCGGPTTLDPESVTVTAIVRNAVREPQSGVRVDFTVDAPLIISGSASVPTGADGTAQVTVTLDPAAIPLVGSTAGYIHAFVGGVEIGTPTLLRVDSLPSAVPPPNPVMSAEAASVPVLADGSSAWTVTVTAVDSCGAPLEGLEYQFAVTGDATLSDTLVTSGPDGKAVTSVTSATPGEFDVSATAMSGMPVENTPVTVQFAPLPTYTVLYDANSSDATGTVTDAESYHSGDVATVAGNGFTRVGYSFVSWNTSADGSGASYLPDSSLTVTGNVTLYAQWSQNIETVTVTFDSDGGTEVSPVTVDKGTDVALPAPPTRTHFVFGGWFAERNGAGDQFVGGPVDEDMTVYAKWTPLPTFIVSYDANGTGVIGSVVDLMSYYSGDVATVLANGFTREGFAFLSWNSVADGSGTSYLPDSLVTVTGDLTLYAQWAPVNVTYTVVFVDGWGTTLKTQSVPDGGDATPPADPTRSGFVFAGWDIPFTDVISDLTVTATWTPLPTFTVSYDGNGGTGTVADPGSYYSGDTATVAQNGFTRDGYSFLSWNTSSDGSGTFYLPGSSLMVTGDVMLYAQWSQDIVSVTVTFDSDGGTEVAPVTVDKGADVVLPTPPTRTHFDFGGWFSGRNGAGDEFVGGPVDEDMTVYAKWTPVSTYTVSYDANSSDATGAVTDNGSYYSGDTATVAQNGFTRDGYSFLSWNTVADGSGTSYLAGSSLTVTGDVTLYAQWAPVSHTVVFMDGQGTMLKTQSVVDGGDATPPADPTRAGFTFAGWDIPFTNVTTDLTVTATWTPLPMFTVSYDANSSDATGTVTDNGSYYSGDTATVAQNGFTRDGHSFLSWNTVADGSGTSYLAGSSLTVTGDVTLFAQWAPENMTHTVVFMDGQGTMLKTQVVPDGGAATPPTDPTREGFVFSGWDVPFTDVMSDVTVTATWTPVPIYTVSYDGNSSSATGSTTDTGSYHSGDVATVLAIGFARPGYSFESWNTVANGTGMTYLPGSSLTVTGDVTLYAQWAPVTVTHMVVFVDGQGTTLKMQSVPDGGAATAPADPIRAGFVFSGWDVPFTNVTSDVTVTATWSPIPTYTVSYNSNSSDATGSVADNGSYHSGDTVTVAQNGFTRDGYSFLSWNTSADGSGTSYLQDSSLAVTGDVTLYAQWAPVTVTHMVVFVDGLGTTLKMQVVLDGGAATPPTDPIRAGFVFAGWDTPFTDVTSDVTVTATWTPAPTYAVSYNGNGSSATGSVADTGSYHSGDVATVASNGFIRDGFAFVSWNTSADGSGTSYFPGSLLTVTGDVTLYAQWAPENVTHTVVFVDGQGTTLKMQSVPDGGAATAPADPIRAGFVFSGWDVPFTNVTSDVTVTATWTPIPTYTVSYNSNSSDATGSVADNGSYHSGDTVTVAQNGFTRDGYSFLSWNTSADGSGTSYLQDSSLAVTGDVTLYAQWAPVTVTHMVVFVDGLGMTLKMQSVPDGGAATPPTDPTREGFVFAGWDTPFTDVTSDVTVTATWTPLPTYTVSYDGNGSSVTGSTTDPGSYHSGDVATVLAIGFTRPGYSFESWNTVANGTGMTYLPGSPLTVTGNVILYAQWSQVTHMVVFVDGQGTTLKMQVVPDGGAATAPADPIRAGFVFSGWDVPFTNVTSDVTVTATWTPLPTYTVSYDGNGSSVTGSTTDPGSYHSGDVATVLAIGFTRPGYSFESWNTVANGTGTTYLPGSPLMVTGNVTLYAQWSQITHMVVFVDGQGMTLKTQVVPDGGVATAPVDPIRAGFVFAGWDTAFTDVTSDVTVTATWTPAPTYSVSYDPNGSSVTGSTTDTGSYHSGDVATVLVTGFARPGYSFESWNTVANGTGVTYLPGSPLTVTGDVTLYAQWAPVNVKHMVVFVDGQGTTLKTQVVPDGGAATAPADPIRSGFVFSGWDKPFTDVTSDVTVTAVWTPVPTFTVSYDGNGSSATGSVADTGSYHSGDVATVASNGFIRDGFAFVSWNMSADGSGTSYFPGSSLTVTGDVTLFAQWAPVNVTHMVVFVDGQGTTLKMQVVPDGGAATAPVDPIRAGFTFAGWDVPFTNVTSDVTVTATWTPLPTYTVSYDGNGSSVTGLTTDTGSYHSGDTATVLAIGFARLGYSFESWNTVANGTGTTYLPGSPLTVTGDVALYAQWAPVNVTHMVVFVDGQGTTLKMQVVVDGGDATPPNDPTRAGFTFAGWDVPFTDVTSDVTVAATWTPLPTFVVSYDGNSTDVTGSVTDTGSYHSGDTATVAQNGFTRDGYSFVSWNTSSDGSGTFYPPDSSLAIIGDVTLFAQWQAVEQPVVPEPVVQEPGVQVRTGGTSQGYGLMLVFAGVAVIAGLAIPLWRRSVEHR